MAAAFCYAKQGGLEERLVEVMGGEILETASEKLIRKGYDEGLSQGIHIGQAQLLIEMAREDGLDDKMILQRLQDRIGTTIDEAREYLKQFDGKI